MTTNIPAGWYPSPDDPTTNQYWDGSQWQQPNSEAQPNATGNDPTPEKKKRKVPLWAAVTTGIVALFLGVGMGSGSSGASDKEEVAKLEVELSDALEDAATANDSLTVALEDLATAQEDLTSQKKTHASELKTAKAATQAAEDRAAAAETATATEAAAPAPEPDPAPAPDPATAPADTGNVYYANCTAARQAGGAPVYAGQPGYGPHLDRDGDGVGCE